VAVTGFSAVVIRAMVYPKNEWSLDLLFTEQLYNDMEKENFTLLGCHAA
jgi:hypothetical protein